MLFTCSSPSVLRVLLIATAFSKSISGFSQANLCADATVLTTGTTCVTTAGSITASTTNTSLTGTGSCDGGRIDVWYQFVATSTYPTITLSSTSSRRRVELFSGSCGSLTSLVCGVTDNLVPTTPLTIGATYFIRVYSSNNSTYSFNICITDPPPPPSNDDCAGAITLPVNSGCDNVYGTVAGSTPSGVAISSGCTGNAGYDVWYKFTAVATTSSIQLNNLGANFTPRRMQLFRGSSCGSLTAVNCVTTFPMNATGLTVGDTYYIRIFSSNNVPPITGAGFSICVTTSGANIPPRYGNSYINVSKKTSGGVVEKGDTLEVRMAVYYPGTTTLYRPRYLDNVPTNTTMLTGASDRIVVQTNEGAIEQSFTLASNDDAGTYNASPTGGAYNVRVNLGFGSNLGAAFISTSPTDIVGTDNARMINTQYPRASGQLLFVTAFRVEVTGDPGDTITMGAARLVYRTSASGSDIIIENTNPYKILISTPQSLCTNATGVNDAAEFSGTFGSGATLNRAMDLAAPIGGYTFVQAGTSQAIGDGQYGIVKNMSPRNGTNPNANRQPTCGSPADPNDNCNMRMFGGYWDILGDHTGSNTSAGNLPPAETTDAGYMLMVNSDNIPSIVYRQSLTNLCPNTYYEFSAWVKNVCSVCGVNRTGGQTNLPGVNPNLTFVLDGIDRYSTGEVEYANGWIKKGFVFRTGAAQTSLEFSIRTNSPGGGGNDWAIDDIAVATCLPNMTYTPTLNPIVCEGNAMVLNNNIASYFGNYSHHQWQRSTDGGLNWTNLGGARDSIPVYNSGTNSYEYQTSFTVPSSNTTVADSGDLYRVIVATTSANLTNSSCRVTDGVSFINLAVLDCTPVLDTRIMSFAASLQQGVPSLQWAVSKEEGLVRYQVEKSLDGRSFTILGTVNGKSNGLELNRYQFAENAVLSGKAWYRIVLITEDNKRQYSTAVLLRRTVEEVEFLKVVNPFRQYLQFEVSALSEQEANIELLDMNGTRVRQLKKKLSGGVNTIRLNDTETLPAGTYILRLQYQNNILRQKALKL